MYNIRQTIKSGIRLFAFAVIIIQTCYAIAWVVANIGIMPPEHISTDYLQAAESLVVDDYMSLLYALILCVVKKVAGNDTCLFGVMLIFQMLVVFFSTWTFPIKLKTKVLTGLYLATNPLILTAADCINVYAFSFASIMLAAGCVLSCRKEIKPGYVAGVGIASAVGLLLIPELVWFEAIILVPVALIYFGLHGTKNLTPIVLWLLAAILAMGVNIFVPTKGAYGRGTESAELYIMQYFPGTDMYLYMGEMETYYGYYDSWVVNHLDSYEELYIYEFAPDFEKCSDAEKAKIYYRHVIDAYLARGKRMPTVTTLKTVGSFAFPLVSFPYYYGTMVSNTHIPWVVGYFTRQAPALSKIYLIFGTLSALVLAITAIAGGLLSKSPLERKKIIAGLFTVVCLGVYCMFCNFKGFDYRLCLVAVGIFPIMEIMSLLEEIKT